MKEITDIILDSKRTTSDVHVFETGELLHLLSLVAEDAHLDGRSVYIKSRDVSADKIQITAKHPTFKDYWKQFTDNLR